eukprot:COSAG04_NODE_21786_length_367_cov_1.048507_1_plen_31_part_10
MPHQSHNAKRRCTAIEATESIIAGKLWRVLE